MKLGHVLKSVRKEILLGAYAVRQQVKEHWKLCQNLVVFQGIFQAAMATNSALIMYFI